ncbi:MAG: glycosyltransferase family 2 protein [Planctomycetota bacterium]|nr:MAG: glycosyltransferase family 2 protein [Planctomycetota bacterium]
MEPDLTVLIPTFNEEENIRECLESVSWAPKIFIVDSFSTDRTLDIAGEFTDNIVRHEYVNSAAQKNWALDKIDTEWVLIVDSDERVTPGLREEILSTLASPRHDGYHIRRVNHFLGRRIRHCGWQRDRVLRLFRTSRGRYENKAVHAEVQLNGTAGRLKEPLIHYPYRTLSQSFEKMSRYTTWAAQDLAGAGVKPTRLKMLAKPAARFFRQYVLEGGYLDGVPGLILSTFSAVGVFAKYAKLWEQNGKSSETDNLKSAIRNQKSEIESGGAV